MTRESPFRQAEPVEAWFLTLDCRLRGNDGRGGGAPRWQGWLMDSGRDEDVTSGQR